MFMLIYLTKSYWCRFSGGRLCLFLFNLCLKLIVVSTLTIRKLSPLCFNLFTLIKLKITLLVLIFDSLAVVSREETQSIRFVQLSYYANPHMKSCIPYIL